ncbi:MAG: DNA-directed RNA polymerase subunit D [Candidatus Geothermarchaeales archaeon]
MKVEVIKREGNALSLLLDGIPVIIANSIRRTIISEVPTMAIEYVFVYENNSVMNDQVLAHRLGLIPLTTSLEDYVLHEDCDCATDYGCPKCSVTLHMEAEAEDAPRVVYSGEINSEDESVVPVSPDIPLVKLAPGQKIVLEMRALLGRGGEHAKWQPVSQAVVRGVPVFRVDEAKCDECSKCVEECPVSIIALDPKPSLSNLYACTTCRQCERACPLEAITIGIDESSSILALESNGQMPPEKTLEAALSILTEKLGELRGLLEEGGSMIEEG